MTTKNLTLMSKSDGILLNQTPTIFDACEIGFDGAETFVAEAMLDFAGILKGGISVNAQGDQRFCDDVMLIVGFFG